MPLEIERKFLVANDDWKQSVRRRARIRDGLIASSNGRKVRVRIENDRATVAIKGAHEGPARSEYEYEIPVGEAEELLTMCDRTLEKDRHYVEHEGTRWTIDVYDGVLKGVVIAEVELDREDREIKLPRWIGTEVTGDPRYSKINMSSAARKLLGLK
jgi:CYTH domain-containing protein